MDKNDACIINEEKSSGSWSGPLDKLGKLGEGIMKLSGNGNVEHEADGWSGFSVGDFKNISIGVCAVSLSLLKIPILKREKILYLVNDRWFT